MQSVKLLDTRADEGQQRPGQSRVVNQRRLQVFCLWALLCHVLCGCNLLKPGNARQTGEPSSAKVAQTSTQVETAAPAPTSAPIPPPAHIAASPVGNAIADSPPPPVSEPTPARVIPRNNHRTPPKPAASNQTLTVTGTATKPQSGPPALTPVSTPPKAETTVTYMPREAAAAMVIKGPPRQPEPPRSRMSFSLVLGMAAGALFVVLLFRTKRVVRVSSFRKGRSEELYLPGEFKLKDSAIQSEAPLGMLAPERPVRRTNTELLVSFLANITNACRSLLDKLPYDRAADAWESVLRRLSPSAPAIPELSASGSPVSAKPAETSVSTVSRAEIASQATPASTPSGPDVSAPARPVAESTKQDPTPAAKLPDVAVPSAIQPPTEARRAEPASVN